MSKQIEEWKPVVGYEGIYEVSDWGNVKSVERDVICMSRFGKENVRHYKEKILIPHEDKYGYITVSLSKNGVEKTKKVHVLLAEAFIENPNCYKHVHHINHIRNDNHIENLEWISKEEHFKLHESDLRDSLRKTISKVVYQYTLDGLLVNVWENAHKVARILGYDQSAISKCCNGGYYNRRNRINITQHKGYIWRYSQLE